MSSVVIAGDTSGAVTLQAPAVAGSTTLNLPTISGGTLVTTDSAGNVGIGVTPSAWGSSRKAIEIGRVGSGVAANPSNGNTHLFSNVYVDSTGAYKYANNGYGAFISPQGGTDGAITFYTFGLGTAGATATASVAAYIDNSSNFFFNSGYGSAAIAYGCRAWVNFNGTGTVAIRGSGNVSSITDLGTGNYQVNFTTAMPDTNYATNYNLAESYGSANYSYMGTVNNTTGYVQMYGRTGGTGAAADMANCMVSIHR